MHHNDRRFRPRIIPGVDAVTVPLHKRLSVDHHSLSRLSVRVNFAAEGGCAAGHRATPVLPRAAHRKRRETGFSNGPFPARLTTTSGFSATGDWRRPGHWRYATILWRRLRLDEPSGCCSKTREYCAGAEVTVPAPSVPLPVASLAWVGRGSR